MVPSMKMLPSERLMQPAQPLAWIAGAVGCAVICASAWLIGTNLSVVLPQSDPAAHADRNLATPVVVGATTVPTDAIMPSVTRDSYTVTAPPPAYDNTGSDGRCPAGYVAGGVDDAGNEFNCTRTGGQGGTQQCVAYNDANQCTAYYKP